MANRMSMKQTLEVLQRHALASVRKLDASLDERAAQRLLDVHLCPKHFQMPIHRLEAEQSLLALCKSSDDIAKASGLLSFEDTRRIKGIVRVLARTHINRQGVSDVTRGARWKVQSPRVLQLFDAVATEADLRTWLDHRPMIESWLALAKDNRGGESPADLRFDDDDISSLQALLQLSAHEARTLTVSKVPNLRKRGWGRVVLGLHTGLAYINERFGMDPTRVWAAVDAAQTAKAVDELSADARRCVTEFGPALAPSFFADLGSEQFVKPDVHVVDVVTAALKSPTDVSPSASVEMVRMLAVDADWSPRQVDKLMYLACSSTFYLAGLRPSKKNAAIWKSGLLAELRETPKS